MKNKYETVEFVGKGHPDKMSDQISDLILSACLEQDENSRVACEILLTNKNIILAGEIKTNAKPNYEKIVNDFLESLNYNSKEFKIQNLINKQSENISNAVDKEDGEIGAGDQGIVYGYAVKEKKYLPKIYLFCQEMSDLLNFYHMVEKTNFDHKVEVVVKNSLIIEKIIISCQHKEGKEFNFKIANEIINFDLLATKHNLKLSNNIKYEINPSGKFVIGGPIGDTGLTGRKLMVDTYGGLSKNGGGALSGKDGSKVDRSGAYLARWIAVNLVNAKIYKKVEVCLSYVIGINKPVFITINNKRPNFFLRKVLDKYILSVKESINYFELNFSTTFLENAGNSLSKDGHFTSGFVSWNFPDINFEKDLKKIRFLKWLN